MASGQKESARDRENRRNFLRNKEKILKDLSSPHPDKSKVVYLPYFSKMICG